MRLTHTLIIASHYNKVSVPDFVLHRSWFVGGQYTSGRAGRWVKRAMPSDVRLMHLYQVCGEAEVGS